MESEMEVKKSGSPPVILSERYHGLNKLFKIAVRTLLTSFSHEDVNKAFVGFSESEKDKIYRMLVHVIKSLHNNIEKEFDFACEETKIGAKLDMVDQIIEERSLDILSTNSNDFGDMKEKITKSKMDEINYLRSMLEKVEKSNNEMRSRVELLRTNQGFSSTRDALDKLRRWNAEFEKND